MPDDDVRSRKCGRCQLMFAGDPSLFAAAIADWWLCPDCRSILLGGASNPTPAPA